MSVGSLTYGLYVAQDAPSGIEREGGCEEAARRQQGATGGRYP
jgi:hypothetical protein